MKLGPELFERLNAQQWVGKKRQPVTYGQGGMSEAEIANVEEQLDLLLPDDFKYLLQNMKDTGNVMFPWQKFDKEAYDDLMNWVLQGIEFDIEKNAFWLENRWGPRPAELENCLKVLRNDFPSWPKLLPLMGHRFLPAEPCLADNPVFSIMQTDIIYYGSNLASYLILEFIPGQDHAENIRDISRNIPVWSALTG